MEGTWDVIIMSETVYTPIKTLETYNLLRKHLRKNGTGYVGGKRFYFGCGGGMGEFCRIIEGEKWEWERRVFEDGESNIRDVVVMKWK